jgi:AcrR family transcriptional regulator
VARSAFSTRSYDDVGLRDIASTAGIDVGQVVREFGSKEALLDATLAASLAPPARPGNRAAARWVAELARELCSQSATRQLQPWLMLVLSGASAASAGTMFARLPDFERHMATRLRLGDAQDLRAAMAISIVVGFILCGRLIRVIPLAGPGADSARRYAHAALSMINAGQPKVRPGSRAQGATTRATVIAAADAEFSRAGYDHASIRGIAAAARIDPAQLLRSFGSKEALFLAVLKAHFIAHYTAPPWKTIRARLLRSLKGQWTPLEITLRSATSPVAGPILKRDMEARFIGPFSEVLPSPHAELRAGLAISLMSGIAFCRDVLGMRVLRTRRKELEPYVAALLDLVATGNGIFRTTRSKP